MSRHQRSPLLSPSLEKGFAPCTARAHARVGIGAPEQTRLWNAFCCKKGLGSSWRFPGAALLGASPRALLAGGALANSWFPFGMENVVAVRTVRAGEPRQGRLIGIR